MDIKTDSFSIHARQPKKNVVVFYDHYTKNYTAGTGYDKRVHISGAMHKLTIKISDLQLHDSGLYLGTYSKFDVEKNAEEEKEACSALLFVNGKNLFVFRIYILGNIVVDVTLLHY